MRDEKRIDRFCDLLKQYWKVVPDWRFGQLVCNLQRYAQNDLFYYEEDKLEDLLAEMLRESKVDD